MITSCQVCGNATVAGLALCPRCVKTLQHALTNIGVSYADLDRAPTAGVRRRGSATPDPTGTAAAGLRLDPVSAADLDATNTLTTWARVFADDRPQAGQPPRTVPEIAGWLSDNLRSVTTLGWAGDMTRDLLGVEHHLKGVVERLRTGNYLGICGAEHELEDGSTTACTEPVYAHALRPSVTCRCGTTWDAHARRQQLVRDAEDELLPVAGIARLAAVFTGEVNVAKVEARIRQWAHRGDVEVVDIHTISGRPRKVYRVGDVLDLLARDTPQRTTA